MITPIVLSGLSGVTQHAIFVPRIGSVKPTGTLSFLQKFDDVWEELNFLT